MSESLILEVSIIVGVILFSMTLNEAMHGFVAYWLGDDTAKREGRLTLNPLRHIDPFLTILLPMMLALVHLPIFGGAKPVPFRPDRVRYGDWGAALVALAGPLTNLLIAFIVFGIAALIGDNPTYSNSNNILSMILSYGVVVNLGFFIFNMIPLPPLDGSRVLYALAPNPVRRGMEYVEQYGLLFVFVFVLLVSNFIGQYINSAIQFFIDLFSKIFIV